MPAAIVNPNATSANPAANASTALTATATAGFNLYVETVANGGRDSNPGTAASAPLASWDGALAVLLARYPAKRITDNVIVNFGAGNFAGVDLSGWTFDPAVRTSGASLLINGTLSTATPATGAATGSFTSAANGTFGSTNTFSTGTKSTEAWTVNDFAKKLIEITAGTAVGVIVPIISNTATAITACIPTWTGGAPSTSAFAVRDWGTVFTSPVVQPTPFGSATLNSALAHIGDNRGVNRNLASIRFQNCKFAAASGLSLAGVYITGGQARISFTRCCFNATQSNISNVLAMGKGTVDFTSCVFDGGSTANAILLSMQNGTFNQSPGVSATNSMFRATGSGSTGFSSICYIDGTFTGCDFNTVGTAWLCGAGALQINNSRLTAATAAMSTTGAAAGANVAVSNSDFTSAGVAVNVVGASLVQLNNVCSGSGSGTALLAKEGGRIKLASGGTITGTVEIQLDATTETIANMRAASPKLTTNTYGSIVYQ